MCLFFFSLACKRPDGEARILYIYTFAYVCARCRTNRMAEFFTFLLFTRHEHTQEQHIAA